MPFPLINQTFPCAASFPRAHACVRLSDFLFFYLISMHFCLSVSVTRGFAVELIRFYFHFRVLLSTNAVYTNKHKAIIFFICFYFFLCRLSSLHSKYNPNNINMCSVHIAQQIAKPMQWSKATTKQINAK